MKNNFEVSLLESGELFKRGYIAIAGNIGRIIAIITLAVSALVMFTDISFAGIGSESFSSTLAVMLLASYLMYFSMEDAGERLGEGSEEYKAASERYAELSSKVNGEMMGELREFLKAWSEDELEYRRAAYLMCRGYSERELASFKSGAEFPRGAVRIFKKTERMRAIPLSPKMLLSGERSNRKSELASPEQGKLLSMILRLIPTTFCMTLTVSVMLTAKESLTAATVIDGLFKLSSLAVIGFRGYSAGYAYAKGTLPSWLDTKSRLLDAFLKTA